MPRTPIALGLFLVLASACSSSRAGWGKGAWREVLESGELQVRRSPVRVDAATGELVLAWIGARVPEGVAGELEACELVVYRDENRDRDADPSEVVLARSSAQSGRKLQFDDVRVEPAAAELVVQLEVRTKAGARKFRFLLKNEA